MAVDRLRKQRLDFGRHLLSIAKHLGDEEKAADMVKKQIDASLTLQHPKCLRCPHVKPEILPPDGFGGERLVVGCELTSASQPCPDMKAEFEKEMAHERLRDISINGFGAAWPIKDALPNGLSPLPKPRSKDLPMTESDDAW